MAATTITPLLKLSPAKRAELALALWDSLGDGEREAAFPVTPELAAELDRRMADHVADPSSSIGWPMRPRKAAGRR